MLTEDEIVKPEATGVFGDHASISGDWDSHSGGTCRWTLKNNYILFLYYIMNIYYIASKPKFGNLSTVVGRKLRTEHVDRRSAPDASSYESSNASYFHIPDKEKKAKEEAAARTKARETASGGGKAALPATVKIAKAKSPVDEKEGTKLPRKPEKRPPSKDERMPSAIVPTAAGKGGHKGAKSPSDASERERERNGKEVDDGKSPSFMKQMRVKGIGRRASAVVPEEIIIPPARFEEEDEEGGGEEEEEEQPGSPTNYVGKHKSR